MQKVDAFTSTKVLWPPPAPRKLQSAIEKYATALVAALDPGRRDPRPDFVFGIEDLESRTGHGRKTVVRGNSRRRGC